MKKQPVNNIGFVLHDVAKHMRWNFDRQSQGLGLTRAQWAVLAHLNRADGVHQKTLAELMDITPITLARHVDRLEREGLVRREDDQEARRAKRVYLTAAAAPVLKSLQGLGRKVHNQAMHGFSASEEEQLVQLLQRIRSNLTMNGNSKSE